jgi:hypothetical protein
MAEVWNNLPAVMPFESVLSLASPRSICRSRVAFGVAVDWTRYDGVAASPTPKGSFPVGNLRHSVGAYVRTSSLPHNQLPKTTTKTYEAILGHQ